MARDVHVDTELCIGSGMCEALAENTFEVGDDGVSHVIDPDGDGAEALREAVDQCPTMAITVEDRD